MLLIFKLNVRGLLLWKTENLLQFTDAFQKLWISLNANQAKYGENLLLQKDVLEPYKKNYKHMTLISKSMYINKLDDIVNE